MAQPLSGFFLYRTGLLAQHISQHRCQIVVPAQVEFADSFIKILDEAGIATEDQLGVGQGPVAVLAQQQFCQFGGIALDGGIGTDAQCLGRLSGQLDSARGKLNH